MSGNDAGVPDGVATPDDDVELFDPTKGWVLLEHPGLDRLREFCSMLPDTAEVNPFGNPTFRVGTKTFATFDVFEDRVSICVKVDVTLQAALLDREGFSVEPDIGHHGWTYVHLDAGLDWDEIDEWITASYRLVAPDEFIVQLDRLLEE